MAFTCLACKPQSLDTKFVCFSLNSFCISARASCQAASFTTFHRLWASDLWDLWTWYRTSSFCLLHGRAAPDEAPCSSIPSTKSSLRSSLSVSLSDKYLTASENSPQTHSVKEITGESSEFSSVFESKCTARGVGFGAKKDCIIEICRLSLEKNSSECYQIEFNRDAYNILAASQCTFHSRVSFLCHSWVWVLPFLVCEYPNPALADFHCFQVMVLLQS